MTRPGTRSVGTRILWLVVAAVCLNGCVPEVPEPQVVATLPPEAEQILQARAALGPVVVEVLSQVEEVIAGVHAVRHEQPRGPDMRQGLADSLAATDTLEASAARLQDTAATLEPGRADEAAALALQLSQTAREIADDARQDLIALRPLVVFDRELESTVAAWDQPGSRSQLVAAFARLAEESQAEVTAARRLDADPCPALRTNRIRWADLVRDRTEQLRDAAESGQGTSFDQLRQRFSRAPYGEDRQVADSESAACWARESNLGDLGLLARQTVERIEDSLTS